MRVVWPEVWDSHKQWNVDLEGVYPPLYMGWDGGWGRTRRQLWSLPCEVGVGQPTWADWALGIGFLCQVPAGPLPSWSLHHRKKTFLFAFLKLSVHSWWFWVVWLCNTQSIVYEGHKQTKDVAAVSFFKSRGPHPTFFPPLRVIPMVVC